MAISKTSDAVTIYSKTLPSGPIIKHNRISLASKMTGIPTEEILQGLVNSPMYKSSDAVAFGISKAVLENPEMCYTAEPHIPPAKVISLIRAYNILTGEETVYTSLSEASIGMGLSYSGIKFALTSEDCRAFRPHWRLTTDPDILFPTYISLYDIKRLAGPTLKSPTGEVLVESENAVKYRDAIIASGYDKMSQLMPDFNKHIRNMVELGNTLSYFVGGVEFVPSGGKLIRIP